MHTPISGKSNTRFQQEAFVGGSCHTPDGAWAALYSQRQSAAAKVASLEPQRYRRAAERIEIVKKLKSKSKAVRLKARASAIEWNAQIEVRRVAAQGARDELRHLDELLAQLEPQRKYAHLSPLEANEANQPEEWCEDLKFTAENMMLGSRLGISHDYLKVMRMHPNFTDSILPHILKICQAFEKRAPIGEILVKGPRNFLLEGPAA
jgi:hypothetical protein